MHWMICPRQFLCTEEQCFGAGTQIFHKHLWPAPYASKCTALLAIPGFAVAPPLPGNLIFSFAHWLNSFMSSDTKPGSPLPRNLLIALFCALWDPLFPFALVLVILCSGVSLFGRCSLFREAWWFQFLFHLRLLNIIFHNTNKFKWINDN